MSKRSTRSRTNRWPRKLNVPGHWFPLLFRAVAVLVVILPALSKFARYSHWVARFDDWGVLWPAVAVLVTGVAQVVAVLSIACGVAGRVGASALAVIMLVAMVTAGPDLANATLLGSAIGIVWLGTGPYSYWDPTFSDRLERIGKLRASGGNRSR